MKFFHPVLLLLTIFLFSASPCAEAKSKQIVRVGAYHNPPKINITKDGKVTGFWADLLAHIAREENWEIEYVKSPWDEGLKNLYENNIDIMPDVAFTKKRTKLYDFANTPILASWSRVYVRENDKRVKSLEDLTGMRIAGLSGSVNIEGPDGIKKLVQSFNLQCSVVEFESYDDVFEALLDGFADAVITNRNYGDEYIKHHPAKKTPIMLSPVSLTFAFTKDSEKTQYLQSRIDYNMSELMNDSHSVYYDLLTKYFENQIAEKKITVTPMWVKVVLVSILILFLGSVIIVYITKQQVRSKTKELQNLNNHLKEEIEKATEIKLTQEKILFEQQKHADMGQMIKSIAHQWRQPLNNIYIISQNLQDDWEQGEKYTQAIAHEFKQQSELINHMSETIDDFLNFFKPDKEKATFNVTKSLLKCLRLVSAEMQAQKINNSFKCTCGDTICELKDSFKIEDCDCKAICAKGYEGEFSQIILNLLSNSMYAISENDRSYREIQIEISCLNDIINIIVRDNGGGIKEEILSKIFNPYFTTKQEGQGIGMGLHMSKTILEKHMGGSIVVQNTQDGLETTIKIPATKS